MKKNTSFRLEESTLRMLTELVEHYIETTEGATQLTTVTVSKASVVEQLIKDKHLELIVKK